MNIERKLQADFLVFHPSADMPAEGCLASSDYAIVDSILINLHNILNTRKGSVAHLPKFGLVNLNDIYTNLPNSLDYLLQDLNEVVLEYEPRITNLNCKVVNIASGSVICVQLIAYLVNLSNLNLQLSFDAMGKVNLYPGLKC